MPTSALRITDLKGKGLSIIATAQIAEQRLSITLAVRKRKMSNIDDKLKQCPFCGWGATLRPIGCDGWYIKCPNCGLETDVFESLEEAIEYWNTRQKE